MTSNPICRLISISIVVWLGGCSGDDPAPCVSNCDDGGVADSAASDGIGVDALPDGGNRDTGGTDSGIPLSGVAPVLNNFRVQGTEPSRVYFDSNVPLAGSDTSGFTISGSELSGVTFNGSELTGHYFETESPFTYWSNNTIRYGGGGDFASLDDRALREFSLTYVTNNIPQPTSTGTPYYVRTSASGGDDSNDGLSHNTAFATPSRAVTAGARVIFIEVGSYPDEEVDIDYSGTPTDPILIQGYQTLTDGRPDDITPNYWVYGEHGTYDDKTVDDTELPTFRGSDAMRNSAGIALRFGDNTIVKNLQVYNYNTAIRSSANTNAVVDNFVAVEIGGGFGTSGSWKALFFTGNNIKLRNITMSEGRGAFARIYGSFNLWENVHYVGDQNHPDYQISLYSGSDNIVRNSIVNIVDGSAQHGFGIKASGVRSEYNLFDGNTSINSGAGMEWRHSDVRYTVTKNHIFEGCDNAIVPRDGTSNNLAENCIIRNSGTAIKFFDQSGEEGLQSAGDNNTFRNIIIHDTDLMVYCGAAGSPQPVGNQFFNMTVHNVPRMFSNPNGFVESNELVNCSFSGIGDYSSSHPTQPTPVFTHCNWFDHDFPMPSGTNLTELDPLFVNAATADFHLQPGSPLGDIGVTTESVGYDFDGRERSDGQYSVGAYED